MKARVTSDKNHPIGKLFEEFFDVTYCSRSTGFNLNNPDHITDFANNLNNYDWTINLSRGMPFGGVNLLGAIQNKCHVDQIPHKVFNIGSYVSLALLNMTNSTYDVEKAALKFLHRKVANEYAFHSTTVDSYLLNINYTAELSKDVMEHYPHINLLSLTSVRENIKYMLENPAIKELSVQYKQPGNHRINNGIGPLLPGLF
jgi:hypothetical protein